MVIQKRSLFKRETLLLSLFLFLGLQSIFCSSLFNYPIIYIHFFQFLTPFLLFLFLANGPIEKEPLFKATSWSLFAASCLQSVFALCQYFSQSSLRLRLLNEHPLTATIFVPNGRRSFLDLFSDRIAENHEIYRAIGTLSHANLLGGILVVGLLFTTMLLWRHPKQRKWLAPAYFLQLSALGTTYSRSAIFAYILGTALWFFWMRNRSLRSSLRIPFLIFLSSLIVGGFFFWEQYLYRGGIVNYPAFTAASDLERLSFQNIAIRMLADHPLIGVGFEQFSLHASSLSTGNLTLMTKGTVHNIYLLIAVEMGLLALLVFLIWIGVILRNAVKNRSSTEVKILLSLFLGLLFIGCCDFYLITCQQGRLIFFGIAGLLARFSISQSSREAADATQAAQD